MEGLGVKQPGLSPAPPFPPSLSHEWETRGASLSEMLHRGGRCYPTERPGELLSETMRGVPWGAVGDGVRVGG